DNRQPTTAKLLPIQHELIHLVLGAGDEVEIVLAVEGHAGGEAAEREADDTYVVAFRIEDLHALPIIYVDVPFAVYGYGAGAVELPILAAVGAEVHLVLEVGPVHVNALMGGSGGEEVDAAILACRQLDLPGHRWVARRMLADGI